MGSDGVGDGQFGLPLGAYFTMAIDGRGDIYAADPGNLRIQKLDSGGAFLAKWGSEGSGDGQFRGPADVAVDGRGDIYVADTGNSRIQKFAAPDVPSCAAVADGNWSDPATWDCGAVPGAGDDVVIGAGRSVTLDTDTADVHHLDLNGSLQHDGSAHTLSLTGSLTNAGTFTPGSFITVQFKAAGLQIIRGATTFYNLVVGPASILQADDALTVAGTLTRQPGSAIVVSRAVDQDGDYDFGLAGATVHFDNRGQPGPPADRAHGAPERRSGRRPGQHDRPAALL